MATTHARICIYPLKECIRRGGRATGDRWDHGLKILAGIRCTLCHYRGRNSSQGGWGSFPTGGAEQEWGGKHVTMRSDLQVKLT